MKSTSACPSSKLGLRLGSRSQLAMTESKNSRVFSSLGIGIAVALVFDVSALNYIKKYNKMNTPQKCLILSHVNY